MSEKYWNTNSNNNIHISILPSGHKFSLSCPGWLSGKVKIAPNPEGFFFWETPPNEE